MTREEAKEILKHILTSGETGYNYFMTYEDVEAIKTLAEDDRPQARWIEIKSSMVQKSKCSNCRSTTITEPFGNPAFCPWCGAKMEVVE